jgi:hypothetical protein
VKPFADTAIDCICERITRGQPKDFQPAPKPAPYPVLEAFKGRKSELFMETKRLGAVRGKEANA